MWRWPWIMRHGGREANWVASCPTCDSVVCTWVTLVYLCLVLVLCTTNVFCILYSVQCMYVTTHAIIAIACVDAHIKTR